MTTPILPLATSSWDQHEYAALQRVIASDRYTMGAEVAAFEREFAAFVGAGHAVMVNSGSSANLLGLAAWCFRHGVGVKDDWEVIVPAVSWSTTFFPVTQLGGRLVFVDVEPGSLCIDPARVAAAIGPRTRAVFGVDLLGSSCNYRELAAIASDAKVALFEDSCESMGATFDGRAVGRFGVFGSFSSFFSHHISTMEGGLVVTDDEELAPLLRSMRAHGWTRDLPPDSWLYRKSDDALMERFTFVAPGYNLRPLEMSGALGQAQLAKLPGLVAGRQANARAFAALFEGFEHARCQAPHGNSSWFGFSLVLRGALAGRRREVTTALEQAGVECRPIVAGNFARNPVTAKIDHRIAGPLVEADAIHHDGFFIGNHHYDVSDALARVRELLERLARG
jgi:CDP-6-deoxy-D-xylo-4-hexulose-3-dehydrase